MPRSKTAKKKARVVANTNLTKERLSQAVALGMTEILKEVTPQKKEPEQKKVPSLGAMSSAPSFLEQIAGQEFPGAPIVYRSVPLTFKQIREIRKDPVVKFCMAFLTIPLREAEITYVGKTGDEKLDAQIADYLEEVFEPVIYSYLDDCVNALEYGFRSWEIRWQKIFSRVFNSDRIGLKRFKPIMPDFNYILEDPETGGLRGIRVLQGGTLANKGAVELFTADNKVLLFTNRYDPSPVGIEGGRYGRTEFIEIQDSVTKKKGTLTLLIHYLEGKGDPSIVARYDPSPAQDLQGNQIDPSAEAIRLADGAKQGHNVAIPSGKLDPVTGKISEGWDMKLLESSSQRVTMFKEAVDTFNTEIIRGLLIPDRAITQGETGAYSQAKVHSDFLLLRQEQIVDTFLGILNEFVIPKLLAYNFSEPNLSGEIQSAGIVSESEKIIEIVVTALMEILKQSPSKITQAQRDFLTKTTGVPFPTLEDELMAIEEEKKKNPPPVIPPTQPSDQPANHPPAQPPLPPDKQPDKGKGPVPGQEPPLKPGEVPKTEKAMALSLEMNDLKPLGKMPIGKVVIHGDLSPLEIKGKFAEFATEWGDLEGGAWSQLGLIVTQMADRYSGTLATILNENGQNAQMRSVSNLDLAYTGKYENTLKGLMLDFAKAGARSAMAMIGKTVEDPELTYQISTYVVSQAGVIADSQISKLTAKVRSSALGGIKREEKADKILWDVQETFREFIEKDLQASIRLWSNTMVNAGRSIIEDLADSGKLGEGESVWGYTRSAVLDDRVCPLCQYLNGMKIPAEHPDVSAFCEDQHPGERCQVWAILKGEREDYSKNKPYVPPPADLIDEYRAFSTDLNRVRVK